MVNEDLKTTDKNAPIITIDWLQFTLVDQDANEEDASKKINFTNTIIQVLGLNVNDFIQLPYGKLGYTSQLFSNFIWVLYDGAPSMGVHVIISGKGCRIYETQNNLVELVKRIDKVNGRLTRIDIAIDDFTGKVIPFGRLKNDIIKANLVTKWKNSTEIIKRKNKTGQVIGHTLYLGSRQSKIFFRLYDKAMQLDLETIWTRLELEIKSSYAENVQKLLTEKNIGELTTEILNNYIRIVQPHTTDTNKSRWETKRYWLDLINTTKKQQLTFRPEESDIEDTKKWLGNQIAPSLALVVLSDEGKVQFIQDLITDGYTRLTEKHIRKLKR